MTLKEQGTARMSETEKPKLSLDRPENETAEAHIAMVARLYKQLKGQEMTEEEMRQLRKKHGV